MSPALMNNNSICFVNIKYKPEDYNQILKMLSNLHSLLDSTFVIKDCITLENMVESFKSLSSSVKFYFNIEVLIDSRITKNQEIPEIYSFLNDKQLLNSKIELHESNYYYLNTNNEIKNSSKLFIQYQLSNNEIVNFHSIIKKLSSFCYSNPLFMKNNSRYVVIPDNTVIYNSISLYNSKQDLVKINFNLGKSKTILIINPIVKREEGDYRMINDLILKLINDLNEECYFIIFGFSFNDLLSFLNKLDITDKDKQFFYFLSNLEIDNYYMLSFYIDDFKLIYIKLSKDGKVVLFNDISSSMTTNNNKVDKSTIDSIKALFDNKEKNSCIEMNYKNSIRLNNSYDIDTSSILYYDIDIKYTYIQSKNINKLHIELNNYLDTTKCNSKILKDAISYSIKVKNRVNVKLKIDEKCINCDYNLFESKSNFYCFYYCLDRFYYYCNDCGRENKESNHFMLLCNVSYINLKNEIGLEYFNEDIEEVLNSQKTAFKCCFCDDYCYLEINQKCFIVVSDIEGEKDNKYTCEICAKDKIKVIDKDICLLALINKK